MSWMVATRVGDYWKVTCSPHVDTNVFDIVEELAECICNLHLCLGQVLQVSVQDL